MKITALESPSSLPISYSATTEQLNIGQEIEWEAQHLAPSAWLEHVPFAFWLVKALRPGCLVELGTERGVSYSAFCQAVERLALGTRCYAVDTWKGDDHAGHYDDFVYTRLSELNDRRYRRFSSLLRTTFAEALPYFADGEVDLLHIDGLHTYEAVAEDFESWRPKLSSRAVVLFHDTNVRRDEFGVWRLWRELASEYPSFEFVHGYGLGVLGIGKDLPPPVLALFETGSDYAALTAVRSVFSTRGTAVLRSHEVQGALERAASSEAAVAGLRQETARLSDRIANHLGEIASARAEAGLLRQQIEARDATVASLRAELAATAASLQQDAASLRQELDFARKDIGDLRTRLADESAVVADLRAQLGAAGQEVLRLSEVAPALQATIDELRAELSVAEARYAATLASTSWRVTRPLRFLKTSVIDRRRQARPTRRLAEPARHLLEAVTPSVLPERERIYPPASHTALLWRRVLIVGELSLPQCKKYRVDQKQTMITALGWDCTVVSWQDTGRVLDLMQTHSVVIFYRVPALPNVEQEISEARRLGLPFYYELDDLIFDLNDYGANPNLIGFDVHAVTGLFAGAALYRNALEQCGNVIASTPYLAERMQSVGGGRSFVIENALDKQTLDAAATARRATSDRKIRIVYGSGTKTHDEDFRGIASALHRVAMEHDDVVILLVGELNPPQFLCELGNRFQQLPARPYAEYLGLLAQCDIAIAPLFPANFNEAKSNIKFLEAATVEVPCVCSPRSAFAHAIRPRQTGILAESSADWYAALKALVVDPALRKSIGEAARRDVLDRYSQASVGRIQVQPLLDTHASKPDPRLHILEVNLLYSPQSFGGATLVMGEMVRLLNDRADTRVSVFTTAPAGWLKPYAIERGSEDGVPVFRMGIQDRQGWPAESWDQSAAEGFREVLRALRPNVVHFHAVQGLGAALLMTCREEGVPFVVTLHDAWWLCERQFLVTAEGKYCGQRQIDLNTCANCVPSVGATVIRNIRLRQALEAADMLLTPTVHWREFHIANGFAPDRVRVNENGASLPRQSFPNRAPARLRFGFVGGAEPVKGFPVLKRTFEALDRDDWELVIVNHGLVIGSDKFTGMKWSAKGSVRLVPPFDADSRDDFFDSIDVLLFPSQWPESFGLTVREALARNKWVIATDQGGAAEAIVPGVNGSMIPLGEDIASFREAVEDLLDRKPSLAGWVNPAADRIRDYPAQAQELRDILASIAARTAAQAEQGIAAVYLDARP
jgi:glycosyltransferase involved in cell wall biosynthesis